MTAVKTAIAERQQGHDLSGATGLRGAFDLSETFKDVFKKEASRFHWIPFQTASSLNLENTEKLENVGPKLHIAELLFQAGLFPLLCSEQAGQAYQWIFYNGMLLSAPISVSTDFSFTMQKQEEALSITIPKGVADLKGDQNQITMYIIHIMDSSDAIAYSSFPKISIEVGENARASIIESYVNLGQCPSFVQANTKLILKKQAKVNHSVFTQHAYASPQISELKIEQAAESEYRGFLTCRAVALYKANIRASLLGQQASSEFNILMTPQKSEYVNVELCAEHAVADCQSRIMARSVLQDKSKFDFLGKIIVDKAAVGTKARLENKNLLLSPEASVNTEPQLEIYNGNIQCSHGATVGHLDENALFYLQSRGIPRATAIQMLVQAFIQPILQNCPHPSLPMALDAKVEAFEESSEG